MSLMSALTVVLLTPTLSGTQGYIARRVLASFQNDFRIQCQLVSSFGISRSAVSQTVRNIMAGRCDIIVTIGFYCTIEAQRVLRDEYENAPFQIGAGIDPSYIPLVGTCDFMLIGFAYGESLSYGAFLAECKPGPHRALLPSSLCEDVPWKVRFTAHLEEQLTTRGWTVEMCERRDPRELQKAISAAGERCDTILMAEGFVPLSIAQYCSYISYAGHKTLFASDLDQVATGAAAIGYGGDFLPLAREIERWVLYFLKRGIDRNRFYEQVTVDIDRMYAVNTAAAADQGLDPSHVEAVCRAWKGEVYTTVERTLRASLGAPFASGQDEKSWY